MRQLMLVALTVLLVFSFTACAALKKEDEKIRVKCPACGYEFEVPTNGG